MYTVDGPLIRENQDMETGFGKNPIISVNL
jgi:hypothetical protein